MNIQLQRVLNAVVASSLVVFFSITFQWRIKIKVLVS